VEEPTLHLTMKALMGQNYPGTYSAEEEKWAANSLEDRNGRLKDCFVFEWNRNQVFLPVWRILIVKMLL
jgi:hypothetical protein